MNRNTLKKHRNIVIFLHNTIDTIVFFMGLLLTENLINYVKRAGHNNMCISKKLIVLGNGPSLTKNLKNWDNKDSRENLDFIAVNYFCHSEYFNKLQPKYYVLSDPAFFDDKSLVKNKVDSMFMALDSMVTWQIFLYIPYFAWKMIDWTKKITNINIKIIPIHIIQYNSGYPSLRNILYKKGLARGNCGTVIITAELIGINLGYKELYLYGVDHNFFDNLCINEKNQLCSIMTHFYDNNNAETKPISHYNISGKETFFTVSEFLNEKLNIFYGHKFMNIYAKYRSAKIYNCTKNSLIDAYDKL
jgi:hypothetical protein